MLKRTLTSIVLIAIFAAFMVCGYFVSAIFIDMLILLFMAGAAYEMRKCLKDAGYDMYVTPIVFMLVAAYPIFYILQHFAGGSLGVQGLLFVLLISVIYSLAIFTFKPAILKKFQTANENNIDTTAEKCEASSENCGGAAQGEGAVQDCLSTSECECGEAKSSAADGAVSANNVCNAQSNLGSLLANIFVLVYPMLFLSVAWVISFKYSAFFAVLFAVFVPIIGSDMFAYFVGSTVGGKKLCPSISPKKTVAGAIGGLVGGMVIAMLFWLIFEYVGSIAPAFTAKCGYIPVISHYDCEWLWKSALVYLALGLICGVVAEIGDLSASAIKRALGIKDYGNIFPGHGGVMDRIDSVMYCLAVLLIVFTYIYRH